MALEIRYLREPGAFADQIRALAKAVKDDDGFVAFDEQTMLNLDSDDASEYLLLIDTDVSPAVSGGAGSGSTEEAGRGASGDSAASPAHADGAGSGLDVSIPDTNTPDTNTPDNATPGTTKPTSQGSVVGAAIRDLRNGSVELAIAPSHRNRGLGRRLLREARERFAGSPLWAHGTLPPAQVLAESEGLKATRSLLAMSRPLVGVVDKPDLTNAIPNWVITPIDPEADLEAFTELNSAAFAEHPEQGQLTAEDMRQRFSQDWFDPELLLLVRPTQVGQPDDIADGASMSASVATANGLNGDKPLAYLWLKPQSDSLVELYVLGVHPQIQGQGLGGALSNLMLKIMRGHGFQRAILYVDLENEPAVRSYYRAGFDVLETHTQYSL